jgi:hypothetical protein
MSKAGIQSLVRRFGYEFQRSDIGLGAIDGYVVHPVARWGYGKPIHTEIQRQLARNDAEYAATLRSFSTHRAIFHSVPHQADPANPGVPCWKNSYFSALDAVSLMGFLLGRRPPIYRRTEKASHP